MSWSAAHESRSNRGTCRCCRERKARFQYRGAVRSDRAHTLCFQCYRSERDRQRSQHLAEPDRQQSAASPFDDAASLSGRQIAHRRVMLAHLANGRVTG